MFRLVITSIIANWFGYFVQACVAFLLTPYIVASLGETRYGIWAVIMSLTGYYGLLDVGFRPSITQFITRALVQKDDAQLKSIASTGITCCLVVAGVIVIAGLIGVVWIDRMVSVPDSLQFEVRITVLIAALTSAIQFPFFTYSAALAATMRYDIANGIGIITRLLQAAGTLLALHMGGGLVAMSSVLLVCNLLDYFAKMLAVKRLIPQLTFSFGCFSRDATRELLGYGIWTSLVAASRTVMTCTDAIIIAALLPVSMVTPYAIGASLVSYFDNAIIPVARVFFRLPLGCIYREHQRLSDVCICWRLG